MTTFRHSIDAFITDMRSQSRISSDKSETSYRSILMMHAADVANRDPRTIGRDDIKRTLRRWANANTQRTCRAILVSFYDWTMEEGIRRDNPARQTRRPRKQPTSVYRMTKTEAAAMLNACRTDRERRAIYLGICAGLRNAELRGLQGRHFTRPGWVWVSSDIAKGARERWVPVIADLEPIVARIIQDISADEYVLCAQRRSDPPINRTMRDLRRTPSSAQALYYLVGRIGSRAGITARIHPHLLRHAFGDHIARYAGMRNAQFLLGHAGVETTETYVGKPTLDELAASVSGFGFLSSERITNVLPPLELVGTALKAPSGLEPEVSTTRLDRAHSDAWLTAAFADLAPSIARYVEAFS